MSNNDIKKIEKKYDLLVNGMPISSIEDTLIEYWTNNIGNYGGNLLRLILSAIENGSDYWKLPNVNISILQIMNTMIMMTRNMRTIARRGMMMQSL